MVGNKMIDRVVDEHTGKAQSFCKIIPGCVSTYSIDCRSLEFVFCLAPGEDDWEIAQDIDNIKAYHEVLRLNGQ